MINDDLSKKKITTFLGKVFSSELWCKPVKTDHFFKLAPFRSPLTDFIDFGIAGKLLTSATRRCSPFVDSLSRI